jgi:hypothetical protein
MTLLNATIILIEAAREAYETPQLRRAINRMEHRLEVLQARQKIIDQRKFRRRIENGQCPACLHKWKSWKQFEKHLTFGGVLVGNREFHDKVSFSCPHCTEVWHNPLAIQ